MTLVTIQIVLGPIVSLNKRKLVFEICKNSSERRRDVIKIINNSPVDTTYQWLMPLSGQGNFQVMFFATFFRQTFMNCTYNISLRVRFLWSIFAVGTVIFSEFRNNKYLLFFRYRPVTAAS